MTPEAVSADAFEPKGMGEFSRLTGVFLEPAKAFQDIVRRPTWLVPLLLIIVATIAYYAVFGQHVTWQRFVQHQLETNPKAQQRMEQVPPEQRARSLEMQIKYIGIGYEAGAAVITPLFMALSALIVLGIANSMSAGVRFKQVFSIMAYAGLPIVIKQGLSIVVMFLKNPDDFNLINPLVFNVAAFMDPINGSKFWYTIGTALDIFVFWTLFLSATGLKAAAGKRLSFGGAFFAAATPWALFTLLGAAAAGAFS